MSFDPNQNNFQDPFAEEPTPQNIPHVQIPPQNYGFPQQGMGQATIPESTAVLVLGIISILTALCYGVVGLILSIIALVLANKGELAYNQNPGFYHISTYNNLKAGKVCAIIGLVFSLIVFLLVIMAVFIELSLPGRYFR